MFSHTSLASLISPVNKQQDGLSRTAVRWFTNCWKPHLSSDPWPFDPGHTALRQPCFLFPPFVCPLLRLSLVSDCDTQKGEGDGTSQAQLPHRLHRFIHSFHNKSADSASVYLQLASFSVCSLLVWFVPLAFVLWNVSEPRLSDAPLFAAPQKRRCIGQCLCAS